MMLLILQSRNWSIIIGIILNNSCRSRHVLLLQLLSKRVLGVVIPNQLLQLPHTNLKSLGSFKVFTLYRLLLPLFEHIQIATDQL